MRVTVVSPAPFEPVTLAEVYGHLRLDAEGSPPAHPDDTTLTRHIATARMHVEAMARRSLVQRVLRLTTDAMPVDGSGLRLPYPPLMRVDSVRYYDTGNVLTTLDPSQWYVADDVVPELMLASGSSITPYARPDAIRIDYVAGYMPASSPTATQADYAANVPPPLKDAVLLTVQLLYDSLAPNERQAIENLRESLVQPLRVQLSL